MVGETQRPKPRHESSSGLQKVPVAQSRLDAHAGTPGSIGSVGVGHIVSRSPTSKQVPDTVQHA